MYNTKMDERFSIHNLHRESVQYFIENDPHLRRLKKVPLVFKFSLIDQIPHNIPGVYIITGGRQVGKTTLLKLWMKRLLNNKNVQADHLAFITGDIINDYQELLRISQEILRKITKVLIIDEITYIKEWDRAIKFLADSGALDDVVLVLSGSDSSVLQEARLRFPGRRGLADQQNFEVLPLSFGECIRLKYPKIDEYDDDFLEEQWIEYLHHGGYLTAINQFHEKQRIPKATLETYSDWIRGDFLKKGKSENTLREVVFSLQKRQGTQVTWNTLAKELSIEHPSTLASYVDLLSLMNVVQVQPAIDQNKLRAAPKKAKKIQFIDPFIFHALRAWTTHSSDPFKDQVCQLKIDPILTSVLTEASAVSHISRKFEVFYIKAKGEVDIAVIEDGKILPIEVKWAQQIKPKVLRQVSKYSNSMIWSKSRDGLVGGVSNKFLPRALLEYSHHKNSVRLKM